MDETSWAEDIIRVHAEMVIATQPYCTPISEVITHEEGRALGSGAYIELEGWRWIVTNDHVANKRLRNRLAHQFNGCDDVFYVRQPFIGVPYPTDVALCRIEEEIWKHSPQSANAIPQSLFAQEHKPVDGELLFIVGYPGRFSGFHFGTLLSGRLTYLVTETALPADCGLSNYHFAFPYLPEKAHVVDGSAHAHLPDPSGLSGSFVWNTRYVELTQRGESWTASRAKVTGIVRKWMNADGCLTATRIECLPLKEMALAALETEAQSASSNNLVDEMTVSPKS